MSAINPHAQLRLPCTLCRSWCQPLRCRHLLLSSSSLALYALQPLPRHAVPLEGALLLSFVLYSSVLIAACILVSHSTP